MSMSSLTVKFACEFTYLAYHAYTAYISLLLFPSYSFLDSRKREGVTSKNVKLIGHGFLSLVDNLFWYLPFASSLAAPQRGHRPAHKEQALARRYRRAGCSKGAGDGAGLRGGSGGHGLSVQVGDNDLHDSRHGGARGHVVQDDLVVANHALHQAEPPRQ